MMSEGLWPRVRSELLDPEGPDLALRITALLAIAHAVKQFGPSMIVAVMLGATLFSRSLLRNRAWWLTATFVVFVTTASHWYSADNHKWLWIYWLFACAMAAGEDDDEKASRILAFNGRLMIGLCMAFATVWKIAGGEYLDGRFFLNRLLFDSRFAFVAELAGRSTSLYETGMRAFINIKAGLEPAAIPDAGALTTAALALSWFTLAIEAGVAWAFLSPRPRWLYERRDLILLALVMTVYFLAPVQGFGAVLAVMGLAQCARSRTRTRLAYVVALAVVHLAHPWLSAVRLVDAAVL